MINDNTHHNIQPVQLLVDAIPEILDALQLAQIELPHLWHTLAAVRFGNLLRGLFAESDVSHGEDQTSRVVSRDVFGGFISEATAGTTRSAKRSRSERQTYMLDPVMITTRPVKSGQSTAGSVANCERRKPRRENFMVRDFGGDVQ
jgi:hypothetical protein